jgi:hypothetical protein
VAELQAQDAGAEESVVAIGRSMRIRLDSTAEVNQHCAAEKTSEFSIESGARHA